MSSSTTWQRVPMRMASGGRCRNTRKGSSKVRRSARPHGRVEPGWRNSGATLPTPTSTGSIGADTFTSLVVDSLFVGETDNIGNPVTPEEKAYGRSLPKRLIPDFPIRAYEYYDYRHDVVNTTFVNFQDNNQRGSGALSWLLFTGAGVTTENTVKSAKYINAKPVYFPKIDSRFDSDNRNGTAYRTAAIHDLDGSTTGIPDSYVLIHDGERSEERRVGKVSR